MKHPNLDFNTVKVEKQECNTNIFRQRKENQPPAEITGCSIKYTQEVPQAERKMTPDGRMKLKKEMESTRKIC